VRRAFDYLRQRAWPAMTVVLLGLAVTMPTIDRYLTWDEAVFFSQSGGLDGSIAEPLQLVASRGLGSPFLIRVLRQFIDSLPELRLAWATMTVLLLVFGARRLRRHIGDRGALVFLGVYGTFWLFWAYVIAFNAMLLAAVFTLIAVTYYLDLIADPPGERPLWTSSLGFGLFITAALLMRPIEATLAVVALMVHLCVLNNRQLRARFRYFAASVMVTVVTFGVPFVVDSTSRFGSVAERLRAGLNQDWPQGLRSNVAEYLGVWVGRYRSTGIFRAIPTWPRWIVYAGMVAAVIIIGVALARRSWAALRGPAGVFLAVAGAHFAFFFFWAGEVEDRYQFTSMIFSAALLGWSVTQLGFPLRRRWRTIAAVGLALWMVAQFGLIGPYEYVRDHGGEQVVRIAETMRTLAGNGTCRAFTRYGTPQIQVASGCTTRPYSAWEDLMERTAVSTEQGTPTFIYGPAKDLLEALPEGWTTIPEGSYSLSYWLPQTPTEAAP